MTENDPSVAPSHPKHLCNQLDTEQLRAELAAEESPRITLSFYRYTAIDNPKELRDELYLAWLTLEVRGRIYLAEEGVNAQASIPEPNIENFCASVNSYFPDMKFKVAREDDQFSFLKLIIKAKKKILADGQDDGSYDVSDVGTHLSAEEWNDAMAQDGTIVVDIRNHYESEVGHFEGAMLPDVDSFREELPVVKKMLHGKEEKKILLYCTGGIRCEKTSAWLRNEGFKDVNQLHGGIIDYDRQIKDRGLENKFIGKNFVFDGRMAEKIGDQVIAHCHTCGDAADTHINCAWQPCHILFIQCPACHDKFRNCCSTDCAGNLDLPDDVQKKMRQAIAPNKKIFNKGRNRPSISFAKFNAEVKGQPTQPQT